MAYGSCCQGGVTLSSAEVEFVAASQPTRSRVLEGFSAKFQLQANQLHGDLGR